MSNMELDESVGVVPKKREKWEREEEETLIELVLQREDVLYGALKGVCQKGIGKRRNESWEEVAVALNS